MTDYSWETSLPSYLKENYSNEIKEAVTQWSRIVAWSWTPILAAVKEDDNSKVSPEKEQKLKQVFLEIVQRQGQLSNAYESYGNFRGNNNKTQAESLASDFKNLLLGKNNEVEFEDLREVDVTLSDVLYGLYGKPYVFTKNETFTDMFEFRVITDYTGKITEVEEGKKYISLMAYPPRPALSEVTVTEQQLEDWAKNINTGGSYLPPSLYIPIAGC